ncbi:VOC family protein [Bradyrhizobium tunisiense]|uniref:VOC family protein n=1 Tax=Bradyrhizobium tunisiense TaxID=3278709 RepID=UPI0035E1E086
MRRRTYRRHHKHRAKRSNPNVGVSDLKRSARFYDATLAARGLPRLVTRQRTIGFRKAYPEFWINLREAMPYVAPESGVHICLRPKITAEVDAFHAAALATRGASDGAPGMRPHDRVRYYTAFAFDPDGNRIETATFPAEKS